VRIRSRSTSASPPRTASIKRPVLVPVSAHGSAIERNCALASTICLTMAKEVEGVARQPVDVCHRHHVAGTEAIEQFEKFAPVAVNLGAAYAAQLLKLCVERLAIGADAGIAEAPIFGVSVEPILRERNSSIGQGQAKFPKVGPS
jgi:hypothetical protein